MKRICSIIVAITFSLCLNYSSTAAVIVPEIVEKIVETVDAVLNLTSIDISNDFTEDKKDGDHLFKSDGHFLMMLETTNADNEITSDAILSYGDYKRLWTDLSYVENTSLLYMVCSFYDRLNDAYEGDNFYVYIRTDDSNPTIISNSDDATTFAKGIEDML